MTSCAERQVRSVYVPSFRNTQLDVLEVFDAANPNVVTGARTRSTLPTGSTFDTVGLLADILPGAVGDTGGRLLLIVVGRQVVVACGQERDLP